MSKFIFTYKRMIAPANGEEPAKYVRDSFNVNYIILTEEHQDFTMVVLDDGFEVSEDVEVRTKKGGVETQRQRVRKQTLRYLDKEDADRLFALIGH